ncbi:cupin domain-containing protein [Pontibacter fetidus]|uniref:Cupin domain-containing protein n=1 Tax=Pontibacter fetidus TaxID=2700082 RepID=A0A6B2H471_9BACT|nr:cupin domain-containing protein [Pontibacter fetidus]NDK57241.1 cupin domain-containing protein [Pontibacter fetidus]
MLHPNQILEMTPIGMNCRIVKTAEQTKGESLEMEWELKPQADGTPMHVHPKAQETYKVLQGQIEVNVDGEWHLLHQGEEITVSAGIPHTFRNPTDYVSKVYNIHTPAMEFGGYFADLCKVVNKLAGHEKQKLQLDLNTAMHLSVLMKKYPNEIRSVNPPNFVVSFLNFIGKARRLDV